MEKWPAGCGPFFSHRSALAYGNEIVNVAGCGPSLTTCEYGASGAQRLIAQIRVQAGISQQSNQREHRPDRPQRHLALQTVRDLVW
jgi:hypothetical protein